MAIQRERVTNENSSRLKEQLRGPIVSLTLEMNGYGVFSIISTNGDANTVLTEFACPKIQPEFFAEAACCDVGGRHCWS